MAPLVVPLTLTKKDFQTNAESARLDMERLGDQVRDTSATLAVLTREARAAGDAVDAGLTARIQHTRTALVGLTKDFKSATADFKTISAAAVPLPEGKPHGREGKKEESPSPRSISEALKSGAAIASGDFGELPKGLRAVGEGLGLLVGVSGIGDIISQLNEAAEKARELRKEMAAVLGGSGGIGAGSEGALSKQIEELASLRDKLMPEGHPTSTLGEVTRRKAEDLYRGATGEKSVEDETDDRIVALDQRRVEISEELAKRKADEVELGKRAAAEGEDAVAVDRERLDLKKKIAAVQDDKNIDGTAQARMIDSLREESAQREIILRQTRAQHVAEEELRHGLAEDRAAGKDTASTKAWREVEAARAKDDATTAGTPERKAADDELETKGVDAQAADREQLEHVLERESAGKIAKMTGTESAKARKALEDEKERLQNRVTEGSSTYEPNKEKRDDITEQLLPQNAAKLHALDRSDKLRAIDAESAEDKAHQERGFSGQVGEIFDEQTRNNERREWNMTENGGDANVNAQLDETAAQLKRSLEDVIFAYGQHLTALNETTLKLEQHGRDTPGAKKEEIGVSYDAKISEARHNNDETAAVTLEGQKDLALEDVDIDEELMTPGQKRKRARANLKRQQAQDRVEQRKRRHEETDAANASMGGTTDIGHAIPDFVPLGDHLTGPRHMHGPQHMPDRSIGVPPQPGAAAKGPDLHAALQPLLRELQQISKNCVFHHE